MGEEREHREFLPPQPAGPEPELGPAPKPETDSAWQPPEHAQVAPAGPQPGQPPGQAPPGEPGQQPPQGQPPGGWGYAPRPAEPDNSPAVAGFVLSIVGLGLLFISAGLSSIVSLACAIAGMVYSSKGNRRVAAGETTRNAGLGRAGWIIGIIGVVLAALATLAWLVVLLDDEARRDLERELDNTESISAALRVAAAGARVLLG